MSYKLNKLNFFNKDFFEKGFTQESNFISNDLLEFLKKKIISSSKGESKGDLDYSYYNQFDNNYSLNQEFNDSKIYKTNLRKISKFQTDIEIKNKIINFIVNKFSLSSEYEVSIHRFTAFRKPPNSLKSLSFHQDVGINWESTNKENLFVIWIPFVSCNKNNGTLIIFPESHKRGIIGNGNHLEVKDLKKLKFDLKIKYIEANQGDVVIFSPYLVHGSGPNYNQEERWAMNIMFSIKLS